MQVQVNYNTISRLHELGIVCLRKLSFGHAENSSVEILTRLAFEGCEVSVKQAEQILNFAQHAYIATCVSSV